jgi:mono/diheme cytochrome c family protein
MRRRLAILSIFAASRLGAAGAEADSVRGAELFSGLSCIQCHGINGKGGAIGPDLGQRIDRGFTPASLASTMWNHAPAMWASMRRQTIRPGDLSEQGAQDLFAYFYSARFFEKPGDAGRGKRLFSESHCSVCHGLTEGKVPGARAVSEWESLGQPITLVNAMWNHTANMRQEFAKRKLKWPELTSQDLTDILVYLRNVPTSPKEVARLEITSGASGQALFQSKGCAGCHAGRNAVELRLQGATLIDIAVAMWNHEPKMPTAPAPLSVGEMREMVSYLWASQFFEDQGNAAAGERVFAAKRCAGCHTDGSSGAPKLAEMKRPFTAASMVSALWHHGPTMLDEMKIKGFDWPRFDGSEMTNLIAYLNTPDRRTRDGGRKKIPNGGK